MVMAMSTTPRMAAVTLAGRSMSAREDINGLQVEQPTGGRMKGVWVDELEPPDPRGFQWMLRFASAARGQVALPHEQARPGGEDRCRAEAVARVAGFRIGGLARVARA